jgi:hypothetical protein
MSSREPSFAYFTASAAPPLAAKWSNFVTGVHAIRYGSRGANDTPAAAITYGSNPNPTLVSA